MYDHRLHLYWLEVFLWNDRLLYSICLCHVGLIVLDIFVFCFVCQQWHNTSNHFSSVNIIAADDLSTQGNRALVAMLSTWLTGIWLESAPEGLILYLNTLTPHDTDECQKQLVCGQWPVAGKVPAHCPHLCWLDIFTNDIARSESSASDLVPDMLKLLSISELTLSFVIQTHREK